MEITPEMLMARIRSLETQLAILKVQVERTCAPKAPKSFAELRGILAGAGDFTEEEIEEALYRVPKDDWLDSDCGQAPSGARHP